MGQGTPLISVIVPVYNVEDCLERCPAAVYTREEAMGCLARGVPFNMVPWGKLYRAVLRLPRKRDAAALLALCASAKGFWMAASAFAWVKRAGGRRR